MIVFVGQDFKHVLVNYRLQINLFQRASTGDNTQPTRRSLGIKHNPRLLQSPSLDALMVQPQQLQRAHRVMLFRRGTGLVPLNLRHHANGYFQPLGQALESLGVNSPPLGA